MSLPKKEWDLKEAEDTAAGLLELLAPHCYKIAIAGSVRRQCLTVGDIEIVAVPKEYGTGLFSTGIATVVNEWYKIKGDLPCKYTKRLLQNGMLLDLFLVEPESWGYQLAIRTGSADYCKRMAAHWQSMGFHGHEGRLYRQGHQVITESEEDFFNAIGWSWTAPEERTA